jgi:hypothetical protein
MLLEADLSHLKDALAAGVKLRLASSSTLRRVVLSLSHKFEWCNSNPKKFRHTSLN